MRLWLTPAQADSIGRHALDERPQEACGLIAGIGEQAHEIIPMANVADEPQHQFRLDDEQFTKTMFDLERAGLSLIGIYHSHPSGDPIPSQIDIREAAYPDTAYVIVGLRDSGARLAAWDIRILEVNPVELYVGINPPPPQDPPLSRAEKTAIIVAAVVAFIFMLILSLSLLPPAPIIMTPVP